MPHTICCLHSAGLDPEQAKAQPFIASMGIYVFKKDVLVQLLKNKYPGSNDFGGEIIPMAAKDGLKTVAYLFNDYWEDIGTIKSFFDANLALAQTVSSICLRDCLVKCGCVECMSPPCCCTLPRLDTLRDFVQCRILRSAKLDLQQTCT